MADWNTFNSKQSAMVQASGTASGWLSSANWTTFNNKITLSSTLTGLGTTFTGGTIAAADNILAAFRKLQ